MAFSLRAGYGSGPHLPSAGDLVGVIEVDDPRGAGGSTCSSPLLGALFDDLPLIAEGPVQGHRCGSGSHPRDSGLLIRQRRPTRVGLRPPSPRLGSGTRGHRCSKPPSHRHSSLCLDAPEVAPTGACGDLGAPHHSNLPRWGDGASCQECLGASTKNAWPPNPAKVDIRSCRNRRHWATREELRIAM